MNYLVYNGFWNPNGLPESAKPLIEAAARLELPLAVTPNHAWSAVYGGKTVRVLGANGPLSAADTVLFWDKDIHLASAMEAVGARVCNSARSIELCDDKLSTHDVLARAGIPMPLTLAAPMTYVEMTAVGSAAFRQKAAELLGFPMVVKECFGSLGGQVYLAKNEEELCALAVAMGAKKFLVQRFVAESSGNDKRLYVVGDRVVAAMTRHSDVDFRANIENGGSGFAYTPTEEECRLATRCCTLLGLQFGGVDILDSREGSLVCEVNSNAHMAGIITATGVDVAEEILKFLFF